MFQLKPFMQTAYEATIQPSYIIPMLLTEATDTILIKLLTVFIMEI